MLLFHRINNSISKHFFLKIRLKV